MSTEGQAKQRQLLYNERGALMPLVPLRDVPTGRGCSTGVGIRDGMGQGDARRF
ncbi:MAG: hypothetical protein IIC80_07460 [Chloroflexi bacterium]|nr:hypothetical protein [Chloroflexota bacterium]